LQAAKSLPDSFVRVDMERASTVESTLEVVAELHAKGANIGPVLQAYLRRTPADIEELIEQNTRVRLCKGAYSEPEAIAYNDKVAIRREFLRGVEMLLDRGNYPGIATHDPGIIDAVRRLAAERNIATDRFEFQMLFGVRPALQQSLRQAGYRVRIYVPYGTHWVGYFRRRILERRENALFALSAMFTK
jgi:proline dehydrogenase